MNINIIEDQKSTGSSYAKNLWKKASWRTRQDILFMLEAMSKPEKWDRAIAYAERLKEELDARKGSRADQDLIETFITSIYSGWYEGYTEATRAMLKTAKVKFDSLSAEERGKLRDEAGPERSHLDLMGIPIVPGPRLAGIMEQARLMSGGEKLKDGYESKLLEASQDPEAKP